MRNEITSATIRNGAVGNSRHRCHRHRKHSEKPFKQVSPNFSVIYFSLWLQRQIHMKHRCKYMVSSALSSDLLLFPIAFSRALSFFLSSLDVSIRLQMNIPGIYINKLSSGRLRGLIDLIRWIIFILPIYHPLYPDASSRTHSRLNVLYNFINVFLYLLHETIFARGQTIVDTIVCRFISNYMVYPVSRYPLNILPPYIAEAYFAFHKRKLLPIDFVMTLWQNVINEC